MKRLMTLLLVTTGIAACGQDADRTTSAPNGAPEGLLQIHMPATKWPTKAPPPLPTLMLATGWPPPRPLDRMLIRTRRTGRQLVRHRIRTRSRGAAVAPPVRMRSIEAGYGGGHSTPATRRATLGVSAPHSRSAAVADQHAGHQTRPVQPAADPHAGHQMPAQQQLQQGRRGRSPAMSISPVQADPHAGHDTDAAGDTDPRRTRDAGLTRSG